MKTEEALRLVLEKCEIRYGDVIFSKELLLKTYSEYLIRTINKEKHNVGLVLHTGSICFDAISLVVAAITNLISNETSSQDIIESINSGDMILYGSKKKERYVFMGIVDGEILDSAYKGRRYVHLQQKNCNSYVPENKWRLIEPYNGTSTRLDGRGIKKKETSRDDFYKDVLGMNDGDIPSLIDTSSVLVMPRERADELLKNLSISFGEKTISLLELVTASYFTEEDEYPYGGNLSKNEAIIKICAKVSVARSLILSKGGNSHIGLMVMGQDSINRGLSELPELLNRKSLQYIYLSTTVDTEFGSEIIEEMDNIEVFACTKDFLLEHTSIDCEEDNWLTQELTKQVYTIIDKTVTPVVFDDFPITWEEYKAFKNIMLRIKRLEYNSTSKDEFIIHAHSLMNYFVTAPFSVERLNVARNKELIAIDGPTEKIGNLEKLVDSLPEAVHESAKEALSYLKKVYSAVVYETPKGKWMQEFFFENKDKRIAVVVPKAYYITVLRDSGIIPTLSIKNVTIVTASRFDNSQIYDAIIVLGDFDGKRFDTFKCTASINIISLLYSVEAKSFSYKEKKARRKQNAIAKKSTIKLESVYLDDEEDEPSVSASWEQEAEINDYISHLDDTINSSSYIRGGSSEGIRGNINTEIILIATFEDERKAFFSKHYKAYVFDAGTGATKEVAATDLCEGDSVVFTKNNDDTKDIIDSLLRQLASDKRLSDNRIAEYQKSKEWQKALWEYMERYSLTPSQVAERMIKNGAPVIEATVLRWIDEDSHTVGPRKVDSIITIGNMTGNTYLVEHANEVFEACKNVRSLRRNILTQIGNAILDKLCGKKPTPGTTFAAIFDRLDELSEVLRIERISPTQQYVPLNLANRPIAHR